MVGVSIPETYQLFPVGWFTEGTIRIWRDNRGTRRSCLNLALAKSLENRCSEDMFFNFVHLNAREWGAGCWERKWTTANMITKNFTCGNKYTNNDTTWYQWYDVPFHYARETTRQRVNKYEYRRRFSVHAWRDKTKSEIFSKGVSDRERKIVLQVSRQR